MLKSGCQVILRFRFIALILTMFALPVNAIPVKYYSINSLFGISMRVTNSICKDENGFIWASSKTGILRLTDDDYRIYQLPNETEGVLMVWLIYSNSVLTAYTNNGQVFQYNPVKDRFELKFNLSELPDITDLDVFSLVADSNNDYWIALNIGLYKYHNGQLEKIAEESKAKYTLTNFDKSNLLIVSAKGIGKIDIQTHKSKVS